MAVKLRRAVYQVVVESDTALQFKKLRADNRKKFNAMRDAWADEFHKQEAYIWELKRWFYFDLLNAKVGYFIQGAAFGCILVIAAWMVGYVS